jgi:peptidoglycan/xylan/chitin deacetylase (PgdA/CDA1 family)
MRRNTLFILLFLSFSTCLAQEIAITIDDAPLGDGAFFTGAERAERILAQLKEHRVEQVAFFVVTSYINDEGVTRLRKYADAGHLLANHTHSHQWIHRQGCKNYIRDLEQADSILRPMKGFVPWFRYPFLDEGRSRPVRDSIRNALATLQLSNGYVTIDNYDWYLNSLTGKAVREGKQVNEERLRAVYIDHVWKSVLFYDSIAKKMLGRSPRHVLLLHENDLAGKYLGDLIRHIKQQGWKIISPADAYRDPVASSIPDVLMNGQGRIAAMAYEKGTKMKDLVQASEDEAYLDDLVKREKVFE